MNESVVYVPVKLEAYCLDQQSSPGFPKSGLSPLHQPDFTALCTDSALLKHDAVPDHDLHNASPASVNPRLTDLVSGKPKRERYGVYLHWMIPRLYRSGFTDKPSSQGASSEQSDFKTVPDRWLVVRRLQPGSTRPKSAQSDGLINHIDAWVVESNKIRKLSDLDDNADIELECSPFYAGNTGENDQTPSQGETFIGAKSRLSEWQEERSSREEKFVPLDLLRSANPLFADYTSHNYNVFSIIDNFEYRDANGNKTFLDEAMASYYVIGWHSNVTEDALYTNEGEGLSSMLDRCLFTLKTDHKRDEPIRRRTLCHGAMYNVDFSYQGRDTFHVPADEAAEKVADKNSHPITVGTTTLDTILAYIRAHSSDVSQAEKDILRLETLLLEGGEDIDSQSEALDLRMMNNFKPAPESGSHWHFSGVKNDNTADPGEGEKGHTRTQGIFHPTKDQLKALEMLNHTQRAYDCALLDLRAARWDLFSFWWKFCSDDSFFTDQTRHQTQEKASKISSLVLQLAELGRGVEMCRGSLTNQQTQKSLVEKASMPRFQIQDDPSLLLSGMKNPWPVDWLESLPVRLPEHSNILALDDLAIPSPSWQGLYNVQDEIRRRLPNSDGPALQNAACMLIDEFYNTHPQQQYGDWNRALSGVLPLYHDHVDSSHRVIEGRSGEKDPNKKVSRDTYNFQKPFFPLFMEYEIRYYHLDWRLWEFREPVIDPSSADINPTRYRLKVDEDVNGMTGDQRVIKGRIHILPQPGYAIANLIQQLFSTTNPKDLPREFDTEDKQRQFLAKTKQLHYLSAPATGFMDHLRTLLGGTHVKPTRQAEGGETQILPGAIDASERAGFDDRIMRLMGSETSKVPYGNYMQFSGDFSPHKPATHGQFKFTKLNVIDKWGQTVSAIDPKPTNLIPPIYPALSDYFRPQKKAADPRQAKTVGDDQYGTCQFAQFPPTINQESRINASFLLHDQETRRWRRCSEWESPVWGFLVVNYAEYAVQLFLPDGTFYREVVLGGPYGTNVTPIWKPFPPPQSGSATGGNPQLDALVQNLQKESYARSFISMINQSLLAVQHAPDQYADYMSAVVGKILALANFGVSLELAAPPSVDCTTSNIESRMGITDYLFPVKIGEEYRTRDGLVAYFSGKPDAIKHREPGDELDVDTIHTYFPSKENGSPTRHIAPEEFPSLRPYHHSTSPFDFSGGNLRRAAADFEAQHLDELQMFGAIFDPFSKIHLYTGILPTASLRLPDWSLQSSLQRMTAFFRMGPLLLTDTEGLTHDHGVDMQTLEIRQLAVLGGPAARPADSREQRHALPIPVPKSDEWKWLAPFVVRSQDDQQEGERDTRWNAFPIAEVDSKLRYQKGPYTAVEGYLQMKSPMDPRASVPDT